jgi:hypothetical protein
MPLKRTPKLRPIFKRLGESQRRLLSEYDSAMQKRHQLATGNCRKTDGRTVILPQRAMRCNGRAIELPFEGGIAFYAPWNIAAGGSSYLDSFLPADA